MIFRDHFSRLAQDYAQYRPRYPESLFRYLASIAPANDLAWDCGTGNGQAAVGLAQFFKHVIATDASADQISRAFPDPKVDYRVRHAEESGIDPSSVDLVSLALALHWLDFDSFYAEVRRVLKPGGIIAAWGYHMPNLEPELKRVVENYYYRVLEGCWPERIRYLEEHYTTLPFPFEEITPPPVKMSVQWNLDQMAGFMASWSASQRCMVRDGKHPLDEIWNDLEKAWGDPSEKKEIIWDLILKVGRV